MVTGTDIFSNVKVSESGRYCIRFYHPHHLQHFARFTTWVGEHFDRTKSPRKTASGYRYDTNTTANTGRVKHVIVILSTYRIGIGRVQNQKPVNARTQLSLSFTKYAEKKFYGFMKKETQ